MEQGILWRPVLMGGNQSAPGGPGEAQAGVRLLYLPSPDKRQITHPEASLAILGHIGLLCP